MTRERRFQNWSTCPDCPCRGTAGSAQGQPSRANDPVAMQEGEGAGQWDRHRAQQHEEQHQAGREGAAPARLRTGTHTGSEPSQSSPSPCLFAHISPTQQAHAHPGTTYQTSEKTRCFQNQTTDIGKLRLFQPLQSVLRLDLKCCYFKQEFNSPE